MQGIQARSVRCARRSTRLQGKETDTSAGIAATACMQMRMPPSTSETTTSPGSSNSGRLQSISRMDGVPQVNRQRSLWAKRSRPNLRLVLKVVDINYPMMQSFKHFSALPDLAYLEKCASPFGYKKLVGLESRFSDLSGYRFETFVKIAVLNIRKVNNILNGSCSLMTADEYKQIDWKEVYRTELELFLNTGETHVLNTLCMFLTDYNVNKFFSLVCKHQEKYYV